MNHRTIFIIFFCTAARLLGGPFAPAAGEPGSDAVPADDARITLWASGAEITRGPVDITEPDGALATFGSPADALGAADATPDEPFPVVSLGDGGSAVLTFPQPFGNVPGVDFAVFENSFSDSFLELAHVEVSSDGVNFFRFPSSSLTDASEDLGQGGAVDPTDVDQLAGKYLAGFGTPFDLDRLGDFPELDKQRITHVRVIDVVGTSDPLLGSEDSAGRVIVDPFPTAFFSGGFDLDAVGAFSATATTFPAWLASQQRDDTSPDADFTGLGIPQIVEYFTGGKNLTLSRTETGANLQFVWLSYRTDRDFWIEASADLKDWEIIAKSTNGGAMTAMDDAAAVLVSGVAKKLVSVDVTEASGYRFFRLAAE